MRLDRARCAVKIWQSGPFWSKVVTFACGIFVPLCVPPIKFSLFHLLWDKNISIPVDRKTCKNTCWDTVSKGGYSNIQEYHHVYINMTVQTWKIWIMTVLAIIVMYETMGYIVNLAICGKVRYKMLVLFLLSIYPHYYSWWLYLGYYNDDFYKQFNHQIPFTITEILSTGLVLKQANRDNPVSRGQTLCISSIALAHIWFSFGDNFVENVVQGMGKPHMVARDIALAIPDILHFALPLLELKCEKVTAGTLRSSWIFCISPYGCWRLSVRK